MSNHSNDNGFEHQDWKSVVLKKHVKNAPQKHVDPTVIKMAKLDNADDVTPIRKVSEIESKLINTLRVEKKISQKDLAKQLNLDYTVIRDCETGKLNEDTKLTSRIKQHLQKLPTPPS